MKEVHNITKILRKDKSQQIEHMKDNNGTLLTQESEIKTRWKENFNEVLNHPEPPELAGIDLEEIDVLPINTEPPTIDEVRSRPYERKSTRH